MDLYITSYGAYVHVKDKMFEIRIKDKNQDEVKHHFSAKKIRSIILTQKAAISTDAITLALEYNVDILLSEKNGDIIGRFWHSKPGSTTRIRKQQLMASIDKRAVKYVKEWIITKVENDLNYLKSLKKHRQKHHEYFDKQIRKMEAFAISISQTEGESIDQIADTLRGLEGMAGRTFYETLSHILPKDHQFAGRSTRPAKDPFNAFLNYSFGILYGKVEKAVMIAGLDPYIGFMHRDDYNQKSFVFDFIEPFRIYAIDVVFKLFSGKKVNKTHTDKIRNGVTLNTEGKKLLIERFNKYFDDETIRYRGRNRVRSEIILAEAHRFANSLIGKKHDDNNYKIIKL